MDRLLTKQEMAVINNAQPSEAKYGDVFEAIAKAQRDLTRAERQEEIERELFEIVHSRTKAAAYKKAVKLWKSVSGELPKE